LRFQLITGEKGITRRSIRPLMQVNRDIVVRPANRNDIPRIASVCLSSVSDEEVRGFGKPASELLFANADRLESQWREANRVGSEEVFVAELSGSLVGCVTIEDRGEELELVDIDIQRENQHQGVGTRIVQFVEDIARKKGKTAITLGTSRSSEGKPWTSLSWWQSLGYEITHEEENEWTRSIGPGVKEIRMRKSLGRSRQGGHS